MSRNPENSSTPADLAGVRVVTFDGSFEVGFADEGVALNSEGRRALHRSLSRGNDLHSSCHVALAAQGIRPEEALKW